MLVSSLVLGSLLASASARIHSARSNITSRSLPDGWVNKGCVSDSSTRLLSVVHTSPGQTVLGCISTCKAGGYIHAGLENGDECWCGKTLNTKSAGKTLDASKCSIGCKGYNPSKCGGQWAISLYTCTDTSTTTPPTTPSKSKFTPNGRKAGISGGASYKYMEPYIGWWYDWNPSPAQKGSPIAVSMLWGGGNADGQDKKRYSDFSKISKAPKYILGFEEPDCKSGGGSAGMSIDQSVKVWNEKIGPWKAKGSLLGSPSMCHQAGDKWSPWLGPFEKKIKVKWDFTTIHINKVDKAGVMADIDYYYNNFGKKPIWVTEFACVNDVNGFTPCKSQSQINNYINMIVPILEKDPRVFAYAYSDGIGLGNLWPTMRGGQLSESGRTYMNAIKKYA